MSTAKRTTPPTMLAEATATDSPTGVMPGKISSTTSSTAEL
ncbi:MAG: hypothetical protein OJJ54_22040 [Pseudonocardia sp.]|nr:hypothetical protein [Pseudonocardia sp.]